jgi:dolichyl-phosphate-mannose--protein O-mannosyl transferase
MSFWKKIPLEILILGGASFLYFVSRIISLTLLPVFADEAIYIRWAQLLMSDPAYLFFSLNDGKPPLFIWSLIPALSIFSDPLFAARFVSVLVGFVQMLILWLIIKKLNGSKTAQIAVLLMSLIVPFWFFHQRMALMDGLLTLGISVSWFGIIMLDSEETKEKFTLNQPLRWLPWMVLAGTGWGGALLTKTPALFFAPVFVLWATLTPLLLEKKTFGRHLFQRGLLFGGAGIIGLLIFASLKISPAFGSLFGRSTDFTYSFAELLQGEWVSTLRNYPKVLSWLSTYLRPELLSLTLFALIFSRRKFLHAKILLSAFIWAFPLLLMGKVLHARYFLPVAPFFTISAALFCAEVWIVIQKNKENLYFLTTAALIFLFFCIGSLRFLFFSFFAPSQVPFVLDDREQYLTEWSSGHGIREVRDRLFERAHARQRTVVVTEGSFGTLPDGLLLYFSNRPEVEFVRIDGLAQYPVVEIPEWVREEAQTTETWLLVNEHRLSLDPTTNGLELINEYPRPYGAPPLQLYQILPSSQP